MNDKESEREIEIELNLQRIRELSVVQLGDLSSLKAEKIIDPFTKKMQTCLKRQDDYLQKLKMQNEKSQSTHI